MKTQRPLVKCTLGMNPSRKGNIRTRLFCWSIQNIQGLEAEMVLVWCKWKDDNDEIRERSGKHVERAGGMDAKMIDDQGTDIPSGTSVRISFIIDLESLPFSSTNIHMVLFQTARGIQRLLSRASVTRHSRVWNQSSRWIAALANSWSLALKLKYPFLWHRRPESLTPRPNATYTRTIVIKHRKKQNKRLLRNPNFQDPC